MRRKLRPLTSRGRSRLDLSDRHGKVSAAAAYITRPIETVHHFRHPTKQLRPLTSRGRSRRSVKRRNRARKAAAAYITRPIETLSPATRKKGVKLRPLTSRGRSRQITMGLSFQSCCGRLHHAADRDSTHGTPPKKETAAAAYITRPIETPLSELMYSVELRPFPGRSPRPTIRFPRSPRPLYRSNMACTASCTAILSAVRGMSRTLTGLDTPLISTLQKLHST